MRNRTLIFHTFRYGLNFHCVFDITHKSNGQRTALYYDNWKLLNLYFLSCLKPAAWVCHTMTTSNAQNYAVMEQTHRILCLVCWTITHILGLGQSALVIMSPSIWSEYTLFYDFHLAIKFSLWTTFSELNSLCPRPKCQSQLRTVIVMIIVLCEHAKPI